MTNSILLPCNRGSILLPVEAPYPTVAIANSTDGEIIKSMPTADGFVQLRRDVQDNEYDHVSNVSSWRTNIVTLADQGNFRYRQNGEAPSLADSDASIRTLELDPVDNGGVVIENHCYLPFGVYLTSAVSYRIRRYEDGIVLERRKDNFYDWTHIKYTSINELHTLVSELADRAKMVCLEQPHHTDIQAAIETHHGCTQHAQNPSDQERLTRRLTNPPSTGMNRTIPAPAPLM